MKKLLIIAAGVALVLSSCTTDMGEVTLTYNKATAVYGNLDDVRSKPLVITPKSIDNPGKIFFSEDFLLVGEEGEGIHVFDNSNPSSPSAVAFIQIPFNKEFYVDKNMVYAESQYDFLKIDLTNLASPVLVDREEFAFAEEIVNDQGQTLLGFDFDIVTESFKLNSPEARALEESSYLYFDYMSNMIPPSSVPSSFAGNGANAEGTLNKITVSNDHVYVIGGQNLYTFSTNPTAVDFISSTAMGWDMETIYPEGDHLFIGTQSSMIVVDITTPNMPMHLSDYWHPTSCDPVFPYGDVAYLTLRTGDFSGCSGDENSLVVLDISNLNDPEEIAIIPMDSPYGMCAQNDHLFVGEGTNGLTIFDINDSDAPVQSINHGVEVYDIMAHPTQPNRILTAGPTGLIQYEVDYSTMDISLLSSIAF